MQAILTRVIAATNTKPTRIKAQCARGSIYYSTTHLTVQVGSDDAHRLAAFALRDKFLAEDAKQYGAESMKGNPWNGAFVTGSIPSGDFVHVFVG